MSAIAPDFTGRTVVVTGAGGNFGRAGSIYFASCGANVAMVDLLDGPLKETAAMVEQLGKGSFMTCVCDVTKPEQVEKMVKDIAEKFGPIHALWNNAGYQGAMVPTAEYSLDDFQRVMDINVVGSFTVLQAVARSMRDSGVEGTIVNTASVAALRGTPTMCAYVASKAALIGLTMSTAKDLAPYNIRVNAISPALIGPGFMWDRQNKLHAESGSPYFSRDPEQVATGKINSVPMKRLGKIEEVVKSVAYLLSDASSYTTGTNLIVDGGLAMR